eukprot:NODE_998_length_1627_cov_28.768061_g824_i0.p1 GENE.NODE_998_length_1627_cov_28.768061_g824_i0~~NODE_998_length_1627_cov_28.768061_g824_i0.p1  ORF type:complete len:519 (-),score=137.61 NODE_998_length_1627_cov_28.768061_g824_i0:71-1510(-)
MLEEESARLKGLATATAEREERLAHDVQEVQRLKEDTDAKIAAFAAAEAAFRERETSILQLDASLKDREEKVRADEARIQEEKESHGPREERIQALEADIKERLEFLEEREDYNSKLQVDLEIREREMLQKKIGLSQILDRERELERIRVLHSELREGCGAGAGTTPGVIPAHKFYKNLRNNSNSWARLPREAGAAGRLPAAPSRRRGHVAGAGSRAATASSAPAPQEPSFSGPPCETIDPAVVSEVDNLARQFMNQILALEYEAERQGICEKPDHERSAAENWSSAFDNSFSSAGAFLSAGQKYEATKIFEQEDEARAQFNFFHQLRSDMQELLRGSVESFGKPQLEEWWKAKVETHIKTQYENILKRRRDYLARGLSILSQTAPGSPDPGSPEGASSSRPGSDRPASPSATSPGQHPPAKDRRFLPMFFHDALLGPATRTTTALRTSEPDPGKTEALILSEARRSMGPRKNAKLVYS